MRLDIASCAALLEGADHGVLATQHPDRGVDAVPVCFAITPPGLVVPVDTVKPKASVELGRTRNLRAQPQAVLLVEHWDPADWTVLWWVRVHLHHVPLDPTTSATATDALRARYSAYRDTVFADLLGFEITATSGWAASAEAVVTGRSNPRRS